MLSYKNLGQTMQVRLPTEEGSAGYSVVCDYRYDKSEEKYILSMCLLSELDDTRFTIISEGIDTQFISSTRDTVRSDICRIVSQAYDSGMFQPFIEHYEYMLKCFEYGDEHFRKEKDAEVL